MPRLPQASRLPYRQQDVAVPLIEAAIVFGGHWHHLHFLQKEGRHKPWQGHSHTLPSPSAALHPLPLDPTPRWA